MWPKNFSNEICSGTAGGSLTGIMAAIGIGDLAQTIILAVVGTVVSFLLSVFLNRMLSRKKREWEVDEEGLKD